MDALTAGQRWREGEPASSGEWLSNAPATHRLIAWWTVTYGVGSWLLEYGYSRLGVVRPPPWPLAVKCAVYAAVWAPVVLAAVFISDRWPVRSLSDARRIAVHGIATLAATFLWCAAAYYLCLALVPGWRALGLQRMYLTTGYSVVYVFSTVVLVCHVLQYTRRRQAREVAALAVTETAARARLQLLAMELQPHFMCNALQSISALLRIDTARATKALGLVRALLSHAMKVETRTEVPLGGELEALRCYTDLQELRFGRRLRFRWDIDEEMRNAAVPPLLLQPLVENAVKFSVEATSEAGDVAIVAGHCGADLLLRVTDDGVGPEGRGRKGAGVGLANARARLRQLYGEDQALTLAPRSPQPGTIAEVRLPYRPIRVGVYEAPPSCGDAATAR